MDMSFLRAAVFDMDGLLVDSERIGVDISMSAAAGMGHPIERAFVLTLLGVTTEGARALFAQRYPEIDYDVYSAEFNQRIYSEGEQGRIPARPGALELLKALRERNIPCAVASSSPLDRVRVFLASAGLEGNFCAFAHGDMHLPSKPRPDIFLKAAELMGVPPHACAAFEDSPNGLRSARAAGMRVIMVPDMIPYTEELAPFCDAVAPSLCDVAHWLQPLSQL